MKLGLPRGLSPLTHRSYALFWVGFATSNTGKWIELTGSVWLIYELTGSAFALGLLGVARALPTLVFSPMAGVVADRVNQRKLIVMTQALGLVASLVLGVLIVSGYVTAWHVFVQVAAQAAIAAFDGAARQALFPRLVPRGALPEAVTLTTTAGRSSALIGPALGGIGIAALGEPGPFFMNAGTFPVLMLAVGMMRGVVHAPADRTTFKRDLSQGMRYIFNTPLLRGLFSMEVVFAVFSMNPVLITIIAREQLGAGPEALGALLSAPGLGALAGIACLLATGQPRRQGRFVTGCMLAYALTLAAIAVATGIELMFALIAVAGFLDVLVSVTRNSVMQLAAPGPMRGRVMANMGTVTRGVSPFAQTQSGALADLVGVRPAVAVASIALAVSSLVTGRANPALWGFEREDRPPEAASVGTD